MSSQQRRVLTPRKRKEAEAEFSAQPKPASPAAAEPSSSNRLLAGYLAHEFLTKGTLFGQPWDPARAEAVPLSAAAEPRWAKPMPAHHEPEPRQRVAKQPQSYAEVAALLKGDGAYIPGVVNPTQLVQWIQM